MGNNGPACREIQGVTKPPLCGVLQRTLGAFRNLFQFVLRACANGYASFVYASTPTDALTSTSQSRANRAALAAAEFRAERLCRGEGDLYLLADEEGNLIVSETDQVIITDDNA